MRILPKTKIDWLNAVLLPFKAYSIIAPLTLKIFALFSQDRGHLGATDVEVFYVLGLFACSLILLSTALVLVFVGPKKLALSCAGFGSLAFFFGFLLLPTLAHA